MFFYISLFIPEYYSQVEKKIFFRDGYILAPPSYFFVSHPSSSKLFISSGHFHQQFLRIKLCFYSLSLFHFLVLAFQSLFLLLLQVLHCLIVQLIFSTLFLWNFLQYISIFKFSKASSTRLYLIQFTSQAIIFVPSTNNFKLPNV